MFNSPKIVDLGIALFAAILIFASAAQAESLYIATAGGSFGILDTELQTYTELGTTSAVYAGLALDESNRLYTTESAGVRIFEVDPASGRGTNIAGLGGKYWLMASLTNGEVYLIDYNHQLYQLRDVPRSGGTRYVFGSINLPAPSRSNAGALTGTGTFLYYAFNDPSISDGNSILYVIYPAVYPATCCDVQKIGPTGIASIGALAFAKGTLFGFDNASQNVLSINRATGAATVLFPFPGQLAGQKIVGAVGVSNTNTRVKVMPQFVMGYGWRSTLYFTNTDRMYGNAFEVNFFSENGSPLFIPSLKGSSTYVALPAGGTAKIESGNSGPLVQGYATMSLPPGVSAYGVYNANGAGLADQDAVVPLSNAASQTTRLIWDDTRYVTAVVVLNPSSVSNTVYFIVRDMNGTITGSGTFALQANSKIAASLRDLPGLAGVIGTQGSVEFSVDRGNIAVTGFGFHDTALTVIPTSEQ